MTFEQIRETIENDYNSVAQARISVNGRNNMREFYLDFAQALEELHNAVGPFILDKPQFVEHIRYIKRRVKPSTYQIILDYCKKTLKTDI